MPETTYPSQSSIDDVKLRGEIMQRFRTVSAHYKPWNEIAQEDYEFGLGKQWTDEDLNILKEQGRPALTFNRIKPLLSLVSGYQRENTSRIRVNPEGGEDRIFSEVMDRGIKAVDKWSHFEYKTGYWFDDGLFCGKGFLEGYISYDKDPIRGELNFRQTTPYEVLVDPECREYDINEGARYLFKITSLSKAELKELYPGHDDIINGFVKDVDDIGINGSGYIAKEGSDDDYGNKPNETTIVSRSDDPDAGDENTDDTTFTVKEYWRKKKVTKYFVIDRDTNEPKRFDKKEEAEAFSAQQGSIGKVVPRSINEMWVAAMVCGFVLSDTISPFEPYYHGFPFFRFIADWAPNAPTEEYRVQGMVRPLKDAQREKNKSKSQNLHILNTQANSGWVADDDALTPEGFDDLEAMGSKPGLVIKKKKGAELREILPKGPNAGHWQREEKADEEFKQISGINPDLMGFQEGTASGKAISMRIKQAILSLVRLFSNFYYSKEITGLFILQLIPMLFDTRKLMKVLGPHYMAKALDPEKYPEGISEGTVSAFLQMVSDNKYDVFVAESDRNATIRYEIFSELTELLKAGAPIPMELIIDYMDLPNSEEVKQKIKEEAAKMQALAAAGAAKGAR